MWPAGLARVCRALLRGRINNPECEQPVTLMAVRRFLADLLPDDFNEAERLHHFDVDAPLLDDSMP